MSHEVDPRRTAGERASEEEVDELPTDHHLERDPANEQLSEDYPHPKRRRPPSLTGTTERPTLADQGATTPRAGPATTGLLDQPSGGDVRQDLDYPQSITDIGKAYKNNGVSQLEAGHRQPESATQTGSFPDRPKPSSSAGLSQNSSAFSLARLPSLSSIAQDLPPNTLATRQSPKEFSSPVSNRSRNSISSRGSSPHASSSSSSSSTGKRRFGSIAADTGAVSRSASQVPEFRYELVIHQQPGTAAAAGLSPPALSRLPIVPSPIVQLRVTDENGAPVGHRYVLQSLPYLVCSCSLVSAEDADQPIDFATEEQPLPPSVAGQASARRPSQPLAMMCGTRVYSSSEAIGRDGQQGIFFIFWDISVRQEGRYRLKFSLVEALPGSPTLTTVVSEPFSVVGRAEFPGTVEIATEWTRHMHSQGLNIYMPALGTSSSGLPRSGTRT